MSLAAEIARVAKLADALDLGSCAFGRGGSTPPSRIFFLPPVFIDEFDNRCAVIQSVHMSDSGFDDHVHGAPPVLDSAVAAAVYFPEWEQCRQHLR